MNDNELLTLLQETPPEELTESQISLLRSRLQESPELRRELASRLRLESSLAATLGRFNLSANDLLAQLHPPNHSSRSRRGLMAVVAILVLAGLIVGMNTFSERKRRTEVVSKDTSKTSPDGQQATPEAVSDPTTKPTDDSPQAGVDATNRTAGSSGVADPMSADSQEKKAAGNFRLFVEAEKYARSNLQTHTDGEGAEKLTYISSEKMDKSNKIVSFAEYDIYLPENGVYEVRVRFADDDPSTVGVIVNGNKEIKEVVKKLKEKKNRPAPEWHSGGHFAFLKGLNVLRLERSYGTFPKIDAVELEFSATVHNPNILANSSGKSELPAPWQTVLDAEKPPRFADICFETFDVSKSLPNREDILRWVEPVVGQPGKIADAKKTLGLLTSFEGTVRLRAPLTEDTALRLSLEEYNRLQINLFHGDKGVSLIYFEDENYRWGAYAGVREAGSSTLRTDSLTLTATDDGRCRRSELRFGGPFEIRYRDQEVILSRGDIVLLRAPLDGPPDDSFLVGKATFYGIALLRTSDNPFPKTPSPPVGKVVDRPADLAWQEQLGTGAKFERLEDGSVKLTADKTKTRGIVSFAVPQAGLQEFMVQLADVTPGISFYLGPQNTLPNYCVRVARVEKHNAMMVEAFHGDNTKTTTSVSYYPLTHRCYPFTSNNFWLRFVIGAGVTRWWVSADGEHWAESGSSLPLAPGATHFGLHHVSEAGGCQAIVKKMVTRPLQSLWALSDEKLLGSALAFPKMETLESWNEEVAAKRPQEIEIQAWRRACLLKTLAAGCPQKFGWPLVLSLVDETAASDLPLQKKLQVFDECLLIVNVADNQLPLNELARRYFDAGLYEFDRNRTRPFSAVRRAVMSAPLGNVHHFPLGENPALRIELLQLLNAGEWSSTLGFCRQLRFFQQQDTAKLVNWAEVFARRELPILEAGDPNSALNPRNRRPRRPYGRSDSLARQRANWASPLIEELSKETYNTLAELQAVLDSSAYDDAARMVAGFDPHAVPGVAPTVTDERLLVSLPAAIRLAIDTSPPLRSAIEERFGQLAQLRVRQAIATGNGTAVELATVQFPTTEAVAEAHRWLGDRALASGRFVQALAEYRQALATAGPALKSELQTRERFAAATLGQDVGSPVTQNVQLGDRLWSAAEFEKSVLEMRSRANPSSDSATISHTSGPVPLAPKPSGFEIHSRAKLEGRMGDIPQEEVTRDLNKAQVDWPGKQLSCLSDGDTLFVSNRFQIAAYNLAKNGERLWQSKAPPGKSKKARDWSLVPMRPLVLANHVVARQAIGEGLTLVCVDKKTGELRWATEPPKDSELASDPVGTVDKLFTFMVSKADQQGSILRLATLDPDTGELLTQTDVSRLASVWHVRHCCEVTVLDDCLVASMGGLLVCCDFNSNVRWIRKQVALPPDEEPEWIHQYFDPPLLHANRLLVAQPGVRTLEHVDPVTGRLIWQAFVPNIRRLLGVVDENAVVLTDEGLEAYSLTSGKRIWRHLAKALTTAQLCGGEGKLAYVNMQITGERNKTSTPQMVWLNAKSGEKIAHTVLKKVEASELRFGPLVNVRGRLWAFSGKGQHDPVRELLELTPAGSAEPFEGK